MNEHENNEKELNKINEINKEQDKTTRKEQQSFEDKIIESKNNLINKEKYNNNLKFGNEQLNNKLDELIKEGENSENNTQMKLKELKDKIHDLENDIVNKEDENNNLKSENDILKNKLDRLTEVFKETENEN